jgi:hypothetical protein
MRKTPAFLRANVRLLPSTTAVTVAGSVNDASRRRAETRRSTGATVSTTSFAY